MGFGLIGKKNKKREKSLNRKKTIELRKKREDEFAIVASVSC